MAETDIDIVQPARRSLLRRVGCGVLLVLWFGVLLLPCALIALAVQGEIIIPQGSAPGQQIRIWVVMEADGRGLGISSTEARYPAEDQICVITTVRFVFWAGRGDTAVYCECYQREYRDAPWTPIATLDGGCPARE